MRLSNNLITNKKSLAENIFNLNDLYSYLSKAFLKNLHNDDPFLVRIDCKSNNDVFFMVYNNCIFYIFKKYFHKYNLLKELNCLFIIFSYKNDYYHLKNVSSISDC